ncbi:substrate-binding domain-containing protein [Jatrophihabitans sp. DSM 45814]
MQVKRLSVGMGALAAVAASLCLFSTSAFADYGPSGNDVVGVGSDTVQAAGDFVADGDALGDPGFNTAGALNRFISIDATADANTRLAYGSPGVGNGTNCVPGTGATAGTGNANANHSDAPCTLNPTVVLRAGLSPIQRPNGSGAGFNLLVADTATSGANAGKSINGLVDFARRSSAAGANALFDSLTIGNDPVAMLTSTTATTHETKGLSVAQLKAVYQCTLTDWGVANGGASNGQTIKPLLPQVGSGTRTYFLGQIGVTTPGSCVQNVEENDPEAIDGSGDPANAIEPMSQSRLFLFQGKLSDGSPNGLGGYFHDPSCVGLATTPAACATNTLAPNVTLWNTAAGLPAPSDSGALFNPTRPLFIYFRHADITSTKKFEPGSTLNWVRTMLFNPGGTGTPYFCSAAGQANISAAGIVPACVYTAAGP